MLHSQIYRGGGEGVAVAGGAKITIQCMPFQYRQHQMGCTAAVGAAGTIAFFMHEYGMRWMKMNQTLLPVAQFNPTAWQEVFKIT